MRGVLLLGAVLALGSVTGWFTGPETVRANDDRVYFDAVYFPWVPNNDTINGSGPWYGSITVQNIDAELDNLGVRFWVFDNLTINQIAMNSDGEGESYTLADAIVDPAVPHFDLDANASVTLNAGILGLPEPGSAVAIFALYKGALGPEAEFDARPPTIAGVQKQASAQPIGGAATSSAHLSVDGYSAIPFPDIAWGSQSDFCYMIADGVDSCDGTGLHGAGGDFDGHSYLPIAQSNAGWNTHIYLSNVDFTTVSAAQVNVTLTESDQQGAAAAGDVKATRTVNIPPGGTAVVDVGAMVGQDWVGSARIASTVGVSALAMRSKPSENMLMINTAAPSLRATTGSDIPYDGIDLEIGQGDYLQYAPLVFRDYHGWNTGLSFVNIAEETNRVTVSFIGPSGNVRSVDTRTVSAQGQEFIYMPASQDVQSGAGFVGAVAVQATHPFHVAVDQVKYSTGEAMSYLATSAGADITGALSMPLVQKGWEDGTGDTSGLQLFNPDRSTDVTFELRFYDSAGALVRPTHRGPIRSTLGSNEIATYYTMAYSEMPQNQRASAVVLPVDGDGSIVGVSNNVNYAVNGDGSAAFNMVNMHGSYRLPGEGEPGD